MENRIAKIAIVTFVTVAIWPIMLVLTLISKVLLNGISMQMQNTISTETNIIIKILGVLIGLLIFWIVL